MKINRLASLCEVSTIALIAIFSLVLAGCTIEYRQSASIPFRECSAPCKYEVSGITLGQVVEYYGSPEKVLAYFVPGDHRYQVIAVEAFYPSKGMIVSAANGDPQGDELVTPDYPVEAVAFWNAKTLDGLRIELRASNSVIELNRLADAEDWHGFGKAHVRGFD